MTALVRVGVAGLLFAVAVSGAMRGQDASGTNDQLRAAEEALEKNDLKTAAALLTKLAEERPGDAHVLFDLGYADEGLNDTAGARKAYTEALAANPALGEAHVALGLLLARTGAAERPEVETQLRAGAGNEKTPAEVRARALRALASLEETSAPGKASDDLLLAVKLTHETEPDIVEGADLALAAGDLADAETAYRRALAQESGDVTAATGLGQALRREGKLVEADEALSGVLAKHPGDPMNISVLASLAAVKAGENKPEEAVALLEPVLPADSAARNPALARELARLYGITGQAAKAEALYSELVTISPDSPELLDDYADVLVRGGKFAQAEAILTRAVANRGAWPKSSGWAEAQGQLAFAASRNHHPQVTLQALAARATVLPNSPATLFLEATAEDSLHRYKEAIQGYRAFLAAADGKFPDEEFEARHRLVALEHTK